MTIVITGSNGFSGGHLAKFIKENTSARLILGVDVSNENRNSCVDEYFALQEFEKFSECIKETTGEIKFFHLGGLVGHHPLADLIESNVFWTSRFIDSASRLKNLQCFVNVGSSAEYGKQEVESLGEDLAPNPITHYGVSKHLQTQLALAVGRTLNLRVVCTRTFNLIGPGLSEALVVGRMIKEFTEVKEGSKDAIELGRMNSKRDFIDVRDATRIYWLLSEKGASGDVFNVASGKSSEVREIYRMCADIFGFAPKLEQKMPVPLSLDLDSQYADLSKLKKNIAFDCSYPLEVSLRDMIDALGRN